ncbi:Cu(I)/Ag(I) efflux RND transporter outer membrane protein [Klebsiella sp. BIGb0407]|uniref:Cu(I)/Ag(I) efflux RND transporter outer membrane protein n=1 Tax=Klebsiella sp. BIGb0407 TaxID=2940603 RepID=UPI002169419F|nr:Cu(I)/Ag(I) efflux RND transporter outer membrane protein [Klebsiella sp. BIGb0407]
MFRLKQFIFSSGFILAGCVNLAPDYQAPELPVPQQFSLSQNGLVAVADNYQDTGWRSFFTQPKLQELIASGISNNRDIEMASLKVQQARAQYGVTEADRYPQLNSSSSTSYQGGLNADKGTSKEYDIGLDLSFELDFFGKLKNSSEAEKQNLFASEEARRNVHILLISNISQNYFNQQQTLEQLRIAQDTRLNYQQAYALVEHQVVNGGSNLLALEQARGALDSTDAEIARREGELAQTTNALQLLLGSYHTGQIPGALEGVPFNPVKLPAHLSAEILRQRPDILEAEHQLKAAEANIGVARAAFYPSINLTSGLSTSSSELSSLFNTGSGLWNFVPKIELPIFNAGRNQKNLERVNILRQQAVVNYQQKIQNAFKQVADSLALRDSLSRQLIAQQRYLETLNTTLQRASRLYSSGAVTYIEVLDTQRSLFTTRQAIVDLQYARKINEINLFTALGGGWKA